MVNDSMSVAVFCICGAIFAVLLRRYCREQSLLLAVGVCTAIMVLFMKAIDPAIAEIRELFGTTGISSDYICGFEKRHYMACIQGDGNMLYNSDNL